MPLFSRRRRTTSAADERPENGPVAASRELPMPPEEMRALVGSTDVAMFDNPTGGPVFGGMSPEDFPTILDFGCGCGRVARQLIQQRPRPRRYLGLDLHAGMIKWCNENLAPQAEGFEFRHHDVLYIGWNRGDDKPLHRPLDLGGERFSLVVAISVFTHLTQSQAEVYLSELAAAVASGGTLLTSWFLFDKRDFPMMQDFQNTLFINEDDVRNAVIYDWTWLRNALAERDLVLTHAAAPEVRGHQWGLGIQHAGPGVTAVELPDDIAERGRRAPPITPVDPAAIGHETGTE
jgi:SAM-dependent methyltransferase